jgi:Putative restriction endonuclease
MDFRNDGSSSPSSVDSLWPASVEEKAPGTADVKTPVSAKKSAKKNWPPVDAHLLSAAEVEENRVQIIKGRRVIKMADPPHAEAQSGLSFLLHAHVKRGYIVASELTTRFSEGSDFASDVCVRKEGIDLETDRRYLEELAFEVVNKQGTGVARDKADEMAKRGVRRVLGVFVRRGYIAEWSRELGKFVQVDLAAMFVDELFVKPIPFKVLLDRASAEDEVVQALAIKGNSEIDKIREDGEKKGRKEGRKEGREEGRKEGRKEGLKTGQLDGRRESLLEQLEDQFGSVAAKYKALISAGDLDALRTWSKKLLTSQHIDDVFAKN